MYLVFDNETSIYSSHKRKANPFDPRSFVVLRGWKKMGDTRCSWERFSSNNFFNKLRIPKDVKYLVGHNIKFDLLYEMCAANTELTSFFERGGRIWDTQYAEYLLNAQRRSSHMASLNDVSVKRGGTKKVDAVKILWQDGVQTQDIPEDLLLDYLVGTEDEGRDAGDIGNTERVFLCQIKEADQKNMLSAIKSRMKGLCATTEMEFRGLKVDVPLAKHNTTRLNKALQDTEKKLRTSLPELPAELNFSFTSGQHVSCLLFGGSVRYRKKVHVVDKATGKLKYKKTFENWPLFDGEPVSPSECTSNFEKCGVLFYQLDDQVQDTFKGGKKVGLPKFKKVSVNGDPVLVFKNFTHKFPRIFQEHKTNILKITDTEGGPLYQTNEESIGYLKKFCKSDFIENLIKFKKYNKLLSTYYVKETKSGLKGMLVCVHPRSGIIHHGLQHTSTVTSRLSSVNPNCQNIPRDISEFSVKRLFISRFAEDGSIIELDYKQLEIVVLALLCKDKNLVRDLKLGVDFHCKRVSMKHSITLEEATKLCKDPNGANFEFWKNERQICKEFSFQRSYGAGVKSLMLSTGMSEEEIQKIIKQEDLEYPGISKFYRSIRQSLYSHIEDGYGFWQSFTGCTYSFVLYSNNNESKLFKKKDFSQPEIQNYPVQGTAGEVVQMVLGELWSEFIRRQHFGHLAYMVNTVHDCVWIDAHNSVVKEVAEISKKIMESVPGLLLDKFKIESPVDFPVDISLGPNAADTEELVL